MKHAFLILALLICFRPAFPFLEYAANYDYISKVLCINKDKPQMQCYGKCYLMKAVKEGENDRKDKPVLKFEHQLLFFRNTEEVATIPSSTHVQAVNTYFPTVNYTSLSVDSPLKPPISLL
ncbi:hypothetical protein [Sinomicrobium sp. M5D2P17]